MKALRIVILMLLAVPAFGAATISPLQPSVFQGTTQAFSCTANCGTGGTWTVTTTGGGAAAGSINSGTGLYTAPATVTNRAWLGGQQFLPNDHIYNTRIDSLSVNGSSGSWITAMGSAKLFYEIGFPQNYGDNSTPTQSMVFFYTTANNGTFQVPQYPNAVIEAGWLSATNYTPRAFDHHLLFMNTQSGNVQEFYQYFPAGKATDEGCPLCTAQSGVQYANTSYNLAVNGGVTAASTYLTPLQIRLQELEQAITNGGTINHATECVLSNAALGTSFIWPALSNASVSGSIPYGARFRMKSSVNISGFSSTAQIILTQMKQYGCIAADGGGAFIVPVEMTRYPKALADVYQEIDNALLPMSDFEAVDESGLMISSSSGQALANQEIVTYTSSTGTVSTTIDLQGVAVTLPKDRVYVQAGAPAQTFTCLANTGTCTWTMSPTLGTLTSGGLYTPPATQTGLNSTVLTATNSVNSSIAAQMTVVIMPSGVIRLAPAQATNYTDVSSHIWYAGELGGGNAVCSFVTESCYTQSNGGSWPGTPDILLYEQQIYSGVNDLRFDFWVNNGTYQCLYKLVNNSTIDLGNFALEQNGNAAAPIDVHDLVGNNTPYDVTSSAISVSNNQLSCILRNVNSQGADVMPSIAAIEIDPIGTPPAPSPGMLTMLHGNVRFTGNVGSR